MNRLFIICLLLYLAPQAMAQVEWGKRFEREYDYREEDYLLISNEKLGITMVQADFRSVGKEYDLIIGQLDTEFKEKFSDTLKIPRTFQLLGYHFVHDKTYLMLQDTPARSKVKILRIDNRTGVIDEFEPKELLEMEIQEFEVIQNTAVIGGHYETRPVVLAYDLEHNRVRTLANLYQNNSELIEVRVNKDSMTFNVLATQRNQIKDKTIIVNTYDYLGNAIRDYTLEIRPEYQLLTAVSSSINDISQVVAGLYGYRTNSSPGGFFVNYIDRTGKQTMNYYGFGELNHFFDYMGEKRANRYKNKAKRLKEAGKEGHYRLHPLFKEMIEDENHLVLFGEFVRGFSQAEPDINQRTFVPPNYFPNNPNYNTFNNPRTSDFDFTHSYALVMDKQGNVLWDDYLEVDKEMDGGLENYGSFHWLGSQGVYTYYTDEEIHAKIFEKDGEGEEMVEPMSLNSGDELKYEYENTLRSLKWYDNYFLIYGVQNVKPSGRSSDSKRVFFINKVSFKKPLKGEGLD